MGWGVALLTGVLAMVPAADDRLVVRVPIDAAGQMDVSPIVGKRPGAVRVPVRGIGAVLARAAIAQALGSGVTIEIGEDEAVFRIDPAKLNRTGQPAFKSRMKTLQRSTKLVPDPPPAYGIFPRPSYRPNDPSRPTVCLIHGINSTGESFRNLARALEAEGFGLVVCEYPYDRDLDVSVKEFTRHWKRLREKTGDKRPWSILTHSMGVLLGRAYVEGDDYGGDVDHLILIGPTNQGAAVARVQPLLQLTGAVQNRLDPEHDPKLLAGRNDGLGAAAEDLKPESAFLKQLNGRPRRKGVAYHILAGNMGFLTKANREAIELRLVAATRAGGLVGGLSRVAAAGAPAALDEVTEGTGDGCVAVASTRLEGVDDHEVLPVNHVELIRGPLLYPDPGPIACLEFVLQRLPKPLR